MKIGRLDDRIAGRRIRPATRTGVPSEATVAEAPKGAPMSTTASPSSPNQAIQRFMTSGDGSSGVSPPWTSVRTSTYWVSFVHRWAFSFHHTGPISVASVRDIVVRLASPARPALPGVYW